MHKTKYCASRLLHSQSSTTASLNISTMSDTGNYIVVFKDSVTADQVEQYANEVNSNGGEVTKRFGSLLNGFSATIPTSFLIQLQSLQGGVIDYIEPDQIVHTQ
ncbi:hypothetical protein C8Q72DRAFT_813996 [Fomitopsis betulina]|nr:hypothetical protein C8Q72DRAFT_813996 [Fomitopsis betulina]